MEEITASEFREVQLGILDVISSFCAENGITYHLGFGTLLGAVRHSGFIPWDDDIDLTMPRNDYERFCEIFPAADTSLILGAPGRTAEWAYPFAKVFDPGTLVVEQIELEHKLGVNVDIFQFDYCPESGAARRKQSALISALKYLLLLKSLSPRRGRAPHKAAIARWAKPLLMALSQDRLVTIIDRTAAKCSIPSSRVSVFTGPYSWNVDAKAIKSPVLISFEDRQQPVPGDYEAVLSAIYGTQFMIPPPEHKRATAHRFTAYWLP